MSVRIYNLKNELQESLGNGSLDNSVIINICNELGIKSSRGGAAESALVAISTISDADADRVREYLKNHKDAKTKSSKPTFRDLLESESTAVMEPPKAEPPKQPLKTLRILPARGRITEVDVNKRPVARIVEPDEVASTSESLKVDVATTSTPVDESAAKSSPTDTQSSTDSQNVTPVESLVKQDEKQTELKSEEASAAESEPVSSSVAKESVEESVTSEAVSTPETSSSEVVSAAAEVKEETSEQKTDESAKEVAETEPENAATESTSVKTEEAPVSTSQETVAEKPSVVESTAPTIDKSAPTVENTVQPPKTTVQNSSDLSNRRAPLRQALDNRGSKDAQRHGRDRDKDSRNGARRNVRQPEARPTRPAPVTSSFIAQLESHAQDLVEMKRPPLITTHQQGDKVRVLGVPSSKPKTDSVAPSSSPRNASKPVVNLHLAPIPAEPNKPVKKEESEPAAQKPVKRLTPEAIRAGVAGPLSDKLRSQKEGGSGNNARNERRGSTDFRGGAGGRGDAQQGGSSEFGQGRRGKKGSGMRDRDDEGRSSLRESSRRRQNNEYNRLRNGDDDAYDFRDSSRSGGRSSRPGKNASSGGRTVERKKDVVIETPCTARQFAETTGLSVPAVLKKLMELGYMVNLNQSLDSEILELLIVAFELKATVKEPLTLEEQYVDSVFDIEDAPETLKPRGPVVTFLGHVDHGKTSLLDRILHLHVQQGEKGGITQHIRAYRVETPGGAVTFVDTPGHEAFTEMRARGANVTDVAVLVVAADDGVMPQTEEAISHIKAAGVPIVVALNKMDLPGVNRDKVIQELAANDLMPSEWGGDVEVVNTSAVTGMGVDELLETLLMVAEINELKANPDRPATGVVLEASMKSGEGVVCTTLVQKGTLRPGDVVLCGSSYGKVRSMTDTLNTRKRVKEAGPGVPVSMTGLDEAPGAGSRFVVLDDIAVARQIAEERARQAHEVELAGSAGHVTLENLFERLNSSKSQQTLNLIIRADVRGSIEAIRKELGKLEHPDVKVKILQASVGGVTEADVELANASDAIIVGFNVVPGESARALAEQRKVQVRRYDVIYKLTEDIRAALEGMLKPVEQVKELGRAVVQRTFNISRVGVIAGCRVLAGTIERDCQIRVIRDNRIIGEYQLETLRRERDDAREVREGYECGMKLKNYNDVHEGDVLEAYKIEEVAQTF